MPSNIETGIAWRQDYVIEGGYRYDFILIGGLLLCQRLAIFCHKEEAHYGKQATHYTHHITRIINICDTFKELGECSKHLGKTNKPIIYQLSVCNYSTNRCLPIGDKS